MIEDYLTAKETPHEPRKILKLCGRDPVHAIRVLYQWDAPTEAKHEPSTRKTLHGARNPSRDHRVPSVVIGGGRNDRHSIADRSSCARQDCRFLLSNRSEMKTEPNPIDSPTRTSLTSSLDELACAANV
jgi:hypothetical protein